MTSTDTFSLEVRRMKRRSLKRPIAAVVGLATLAGGFCFVTTEPTLARSATRSSVPDAAAARLESDVRALSVWVRDAAHPEGLERALGFVRTSLEQVGATVEEQRYDARGVSYANLLTHFGPDGGERVVVGAHYDTCGAKPGADDNASGVAGLLELGRRLAREPPSLRVDLVAFTLEEPPNFATSRMGSFVHAASLAREGVRVRAMISLEMIGTFSDAPGSQRFPSSLLGALYPDRGNFIAVVGDLGQVGLVREVKRAMTTASPLDVRSVNAPVTLPGIDFSDHRSYWAHGYPAVMVTDTAFLRNARYHTADDTQDTLDYERMAEVVEGTLAAVRALAARGD